MFSHDVEAPAFFSAPSSKKVRARAEPGFFNARGSADDLAQPQKAVEDEEPLQAKKQDDEKPLARGGIQAQSPAVDKEDGEAKPSRDQEEPTVQAKTPDKEEPVQARAQATPASAPEEDIPTPRAETGGTAPSGRSPAVTQDGSRIGRHRTSLGVQAAGTTALPGHQQVAAAASVWRARRLAARAIDSILAARLGAPGPGDTTEARGHFERWFGHFDPERAAFVERVYRNIAHDLGRSDLAFFRNDHRNWYAYVLATRGPLNIWLCRLFWNKARDSGFNSRPGTLVHELAHEASLGVSDFGYGVPNATDLANHDPHRALFNADNYAFFAESLKR